MRILITGGLGYIGGRLAGYLKEKDPGLGIFLTTWKGKEIVPQWAESFNILSMELLDEGSIRECVAESKPDYIIHLAALNEIDSFANPQLAEEINFRGTKKLLRAASLNNVRAFVYFSTFHVYGKFGGVVITEKTPTGPNHPYSATHLNAERTVASFGGEEMDVLIFRLSNSYGYPMDKEVNRWTLVVNDLCRQVILKGKIVLKSSGSQYRDFISLHDVVRAVHYFLFSILGSWGDGLYNLGSGRTMSILEMAQKISEIYCSKYQKREKPEIIRMEEDVTEIKDFTYDVSKLIQTGFRLEGNMDAEIEKTMEVCESFCKEGK